MTAVTVAPSQLTQKELGLMYQYTVEAYKTFEKLAEHLPNPIARELFKQFAVDERNTRDLLEMKIASVPDVRVRATLGNDLSFQDILEGDMSYRETTEFLIFRERSMEKKLREIGANASLLDRGLLVYLAAGKRAHIVELERELELIRIDSDWFKREDAEHRLVYGMKNEP